MAKIKLYVLTILSLISLSLYLSPAVLAVSGPVEFVVPDTTLLVSGQASPGALVSIYDGNTLIGTTVADSKANFSKQFTALKPGLRKLRIDYVDRSGRKSSIVSDTISVAFQRETAAEYFLPPTFEIAPKSVTESDIVTFQGSSVPSSEVAVVVDGGNTVLRPQVDADGNYSISLATDGFFIGQHPASAKAKYANKTSFETEKSQFDVLPSEKSYTNNNKPNSLDPPVIVSPNSPHQTDSEDLLVRGTSAPNQQIIIFLDGEPVGSTFSNNDGVWFFNIKLLNKNQTIRAITCVGSECSDFSSSLEVEFTGVFGRCNDLRFRLDDYRFWGINPNQGVEINIDQITGEPDYEMIVDWGDRITEKFDHSDQNGFILQHTYKQTGQFNGTVTVEDSRGCTLSRNFSVSVEKKQFQPVDLWWAAPAALTVGFAFLLRFKKPD